jgi:hypothetical protein
MFLETSATVPCHESVKTNFQAFFFTSGKVTNGRIPALRPHEYRGVHRSALLKVLAAELPEGTVRYGTAVEQLAPRQKNHGAELILGGGQRLHAKVCSPKLFHIHLGNTG